MRSSPINEETGEVGTYPVSVLYQHLDPVIVELTIDDETITTTPEHPFYTDSSVWVDAADLVMGDEIRTLEGATARSTTESVLNRI